MTMGLSLCLWSCKGQDGILKPSMRLAQITISPTELVLIYNNVTYKIKKTIK